MGNEILREIESFIVITMRLFEKYNVLFSRTIKIMDNKELLLIPSFLCWASMKDSFGNTGSLQVGFQKNYMKM
jgi:hypothetical protein